VRIVVLLAGRRRRRDCIKVDRPGQGGYRGMQARGRAGEGMTERQWVAWADPVKMLKWARAGLTDRQLRLFACACARRVWHVLTEEESRRAVEVAERLADGEATEG